MYTAASSVIFVCWFGYWCHTFSETGYVGDMSTASLSSLESALGQSNADGGISVDSLGGPKMCGDIDIRVTSDGTWHYLGSPILRKPLVKLFASVLRREESGEYWLVTPSEMCRINVDDAPFTAVEMMVEGEGKYQRLIFRTNLDETVAAGPDHLIRVQIDEQTSEPRPYLQLRDGLEALIVRAVFYELIEIGEERRRNGKSFIGVWSDGIFCEIGALENG